MNTPMNSLNTQIYGEATEWIILHRSDALDVHAKKRFDAWLRESPQHLRAYLEMSTIWEDVPALRPEWNASAPELIARARAEGNVFPLGVETVPEVPYCQLDAVSTHASGLSAQALSVEPLLQSVPAVTVPGSQSQLMKRLAIAALLVITVSITGWFYLFHNVYATDIGEQRALALVDGSTVELNSQTKIRIAYTDNQRTIQLLRGQALFKVAKDPNRPFIVDSNGTRVRAVGTQFDVYRKAGGTQVTVVEGRVAVGSESTGGDTARVGATARPQAGAGSPQSTLQAHLGEILVSAGEQILIAQSTLTPEFLALESSTGRVPVTTESPTAALAPPVPQPANVEAATAWTQQRLVFDFSPLSEVAQEFNRYNHRPLIIDDPTLETFNISGSFSSTDPTLLLRFLREQPGIVVNETPDEIRISRENTHG